MFTAQMLVDQVLVQLPLKAPSPEKLHGSTECYKLLKSWQNKSQH